MKKDIF